MHHLKIDAVVIGVALHTGRAGRARSRKRCMQTFVLLDLIGNFPMAIQTFEGGRLHGNLVALGAIRSPTQALMSFRQRPRRDLRSGRNTKAQHKTDEKERAMLPIAASNFSALPASAANALLPLHPSPSH